MKLEHDSSWEIVGKECTIRAFQLANLGAEATGPLFLSIYVKPDTGYDGTGSPGRLLSRAEISPLGPGAVANDIVVTAKARGVPHREQYTALVVEEQAGSKTFTIADYVVFTSTYAFPAKQNGGVGSQDTGIGDGNITLQGATLAGAARAGEFSIDRIQNLRNSFTGELRLAVYAAPEPYADGAEKAVIATRPLGQLAPGDFYNHLQGRLSFKRPGRGTFYLTLALEEDQGSGFQTIIYSNIPEPRPF
ncbi:MAG TPA: hypothetical protein VGF13_14750 [Verrucomicrobiae bacterium]